MKKIVLLTLTLLGSNLYARGGGTIGSDAICGDKALQYAVIESYKKTSNPTKTCGINELNIGQNTETFVVCIKENTNYSEYIVTLDRVKRSCPLNSIHLSTENKAPSFILPESTIGGHLVCSIENAQRNLICKKTKTHEDVQREIQNKDICYKTLLNKMENTEGFEGLSVIDRDYAVEAVNEAHFDHVSDEEKIIFNKQVKNKNTLYYMLYWTAPSNSGSSVLLADSKTCQEIGFYTVDSEE